MRFLGRSILLALCVSALLMAGCGEKRSVAGMPAPASQPGEKPVTKGDSPDSTAPGSIAAEAKPDPAANAGASVQPARPSIPTEEPPKPSVPSLQTKSYTIALNMNKGDEVRYQNDMEMNLTMGTMKGMPENQQLPKNMGTKWTYTQKYKVDNATAAAIDLKATIEDVKVEDNSKAKASVMDLSKMMADGMQQMKGKTVSQKIGRDGQLLSAGTDVDAQAAMAMQGFTQAMGFQGVFFPKKPVKVGDTWQNKMEFSKLMAGARSMGPGSSMKMDDIPVTTKFLAVEGDEANPVGVMEVTINSKPHMQMSISGADKAKTSMGLTMDMQINGKTVVRVNLKSGLVISSTGSTTAAMNMKFPTAADSKAPAGSMSMTQTVKVAMRKL